MVDFAHDKELKVYGNKPSSLDSPVPEESAPPLEAPDSQELAQGLVDGGMGGMYLPAEEEDEFAEFATPQGGDEFAEFAAPEEPRVLEKDLTFDELAEQVGTPDALRQTADRAMTRLRLSFAGNNNEVVNELQQKFGKDKAKMIDGEVYFRYPGTKDFVPFDPEDEGFGELLDHGRLMLEMAIEEGLTLGAGPLNLVTGGATMGAAAVAATNIGDIIARELLGIETDPKRNLLEESAIAGAFGVASGVLAAKLARRKLAKGNVSSFEALEAATRAEQEAANLNQKLGEFGADIKIKDSRMILSPGQRMGPDAPEGALLDKHLSDDDNVRKFFTKQGEQFEDAADKIITAVGNTTGKSVDEMFSQVKQIGKLEQKITGQLIGEFRDQALRATKGEAQDLPRSLGRLEEAVSAFGGRVQTIKGRDGRVTQRVVFNDPKLIQTNNFVDSSPAQVKRAQDLLERLGNEALNGQGKLSLQRVDRYYDQLKSIINSTADSRKHSKIARSLFDLKDGLRDDWADIIGKELPEGSREIYLNNMKKYSELMNAQKSLRGILGKDDLSRKAFTDRIFNKQLGKERLKHMKVLIKDQSPELWGQMRSEFLSDIVSKHKTLGQKGGKSDARAINWKNVFGEIEDLKKAGIYDELFDGNKMAGNTFYELMKTARKLDSFDFKPKQMETKGFLQKLRQIAILSANVSGVAKLTEAERMVLSLDKKKALAAWLDGEGTALLLQTARTPKEKDVLRKFSLDVAKSAGRVGARQQMQREGE